MSTMSDAPITLTVSRAAIRCSAMRHLRALQGLLEKHGAYIFGMEDNGGTRPVYIYKMKNKQ